MSHFYDPDLVAELRDAGRMVARAPEHEPQIATCGECGRSWDDALVTSMTPTPSARCPFEAFDPGEPIPADYPVQPVRGPQDESRGHH